jgi:HEAT repeat protein
MRRTLAATLVILLLPVAAARPDPAYREKTARQWMAELQEALQAEAALPEDSPQGDGQKDRLHRAQWYAVYALGQMGQDAAPAVDLLAATLADKSRYEYVRAGAAWALGCIGPQAAKATPTLVEALQSTLASIRRHAARALGQIGPDARSAVPNLVPILESDDVTLRVRAAVALWRIAEHPRAIPTLIETLRQEGDSKAFQAAVALGKIGSDNQSALDALIAAFGHPDADVRRAAARSFAQITPSFSKALASLEKPLADGNSRVRRTAVTALGWLGLDARQTLLDILQKDPDPAVRTAAEAALTRIRQVGQGLP